MKLKVMFYCFVMIILNACNGTGSQANSLQQNLTSQEIKGQSLKINHVIVQNVKLTNSVVGVGMPINSANGLIWSTICSGTVIDQDWILTAAHCVADSLQKVGGGEFFPILRSQPIYIIPSQFSGGIPRIYDPLDLVHVEKFPVEAIYIPANYNDYIYSGHGVPMGRPYNNFLNEDFALLKLETRLPEIYKPLSIDDKPINSNDIPLYLSGYGSGVHDSTFRHLNYKQIVYVANKLNSNTTVLDFKQIYATGTKPAYSESEPYGFACSYAEEGDDGAPILYTDKHSGNEMVVGIYSSNMYINTLNKFCERMPYPVAANVSIPEYKNFITSIMNDTALGSEYRCISINGTCFPGFAYVPNLQSNTISLFRVNKKSGILQIQGGAAIASNLQFPVANIVDSSGNYLFVLNMGNANHAGYIASYKRNPYNGMVTFINNFQTGYMPVDIARDSSGQYLFVINNKDDNLFLYKINKDSGSLRFISSIITGKSPNSITVTSRFIYVTNYVDNSISVFSFKDGHTVSYYATLANKEPEQIKISPSGKYAVVLSRFGGNGILATYRVGKSGSLTEKFDSANLGAPPLVEPSRMLIIDEYIFVTSMKNNILSIYRLNENGSLRYVGRDTYLAGPVSEIAVDKSGDNIYLTLTGVNKIAHFINHHDGRLSFVSDSIKTGYYPAGIAMTNQ